MINTDLISASAESLLETNAKILERDLKLGKTSNWVRMPPEEGKRAIEALNFLAAANTTKVGLSQLKRYRRYIVSDGETPLHETAYHIIMVVTSLVERI